MKLQTLKHIEEEVERAPGVPSGRNSIDISSVVDNINVLLARTTAQCFLTPYIALERVAKVMAHFHVFLPKYSFMEGDSGVAVFPVEQYGTKVGMRNDGTVVTAEPSPYSLFFEYQMNDKGTFDIYTEVVDEDDLNELIDNVEQELEEAIVMPETGPKHTPGSLVSGQPPYGDEDCDEDYVNMSTTGRSIKTKQAKQEKPGIKFAGPETGSRQMPGSIIKKLQERILKN